MFNQTIKPWKAIGLLGAALAMAGCVTVDSARDRFQRRPSVETVEGIGWGSNYERFLTGRDESKMSEAFLRAMSGPLNDGRHWRTRRTGASGEIVGGEAYLQNVDYARGQQPTAPLDLSTDYQLEPAQGDYTLLSNTNVRLGPSTSDSIVETMDQGTVVEAVGSVRGLDWMLMARDGEIIGYMYAPLLEQREGGDLLLAGGAPRTPTYCRRYVQELRLEGGIRDRWEGAACRNARGYWYVDGAPIEGS